MTGHWRASLLIVATLSAVIAPLEAVLAAPNPQLRVAGFLAVTTGGGSSQISSFKADGTGQQKLTQGPANHYAPAVSPDGRQVLFQGEDGGGSGIYRMNIDGSGVIPITTAPVIAGSPSWAPDGATIAYAARAGTGRFQVYTARSDGSGAQAITNSADSYNGQPVFSPDGALIAYANTKQDTTGGGSVPVTRIWVMSAKDGSGAHALSAGPGDYYPAWLNKDALLFARSSNQGQQFQVFSVTTAGVEKAQSPASQYVTEPKPLPDGKTYVATHQNGAAFEIVKISRSDGAALAALPGSIVLLAGVTIEGFVLDKIVIGDGDVFSYFPILALVVAPPAGKPGGAPGPASPSFPWLPVLGVLLLLLLVGGGVYLVGSPATRERRRVGGHGPVRPFVPHRRDCTAEEAAAAAAQAAIGPAIKAFESIDALKGQAAATAAAAKAPKAALEAATKAGPLATTTDPITGKTVERWGAAYTRAKAASDAAQAKAEAARSAYEGAGGDSAWQAASAALRQARAALAAAEAALRECGEDVAAHADPAPGSVSPPDERPPLPPPPGDPPCKDGETQPAVTGATETLRLYLLGDLRVERSDESPYAGDAKKAIDLLRKAQPIVSTLVNRIPGAGLGYAKWFGVMSKQAAEGLVRTDELVKKARDQGSTATVFCPVQEVTASCVTQMVCTGGAWIKHCSLEITPVGEPHWVTAPANISALSNDMVVQGAWAYFTGQHDAQDRRREALETSCAAECH